MVEEKRPGEYFPVYEDDTGTYIYNSKDLCTIEFIDKLIDAGLSGLKIEGRMKSHFYCAATTKIYREALDSYLSGNYTYNPKWKSDLEKISHRGYTSGFYTGKLDPNSEQQAGNTPSTHRFAAIVKKKLEGPYWQVEIRERFDPSKEIEILRPKQRNTAIQMTHIEDLKTQKPITLAQPNMVVRAKFDQNVEELDILCTDQVVEAV